ncbi:MAG: hypothetical protein J6Y00_05525 [Paludibacteraceae bacterium]|nr:hypothetical protein [Paludibacteraceae bacterium]
MKKNLLFLLALLTVSVAGCKKNSEEPDGPKPDQDTVAAIQLSETNIRMVQITWNEKAREEQPTVHTLTITPEDGEYTVTASEEGIVNTRIQGNKLQLTANNIGTTRLTITDTVTLETAVCQVEVYSVIETLTFPYATVSYYFRDWDMESYPVKDSAFFYDDAEGNSIPLRAYIVDAELTLYSEGFYLKDEMFEGTDIGYIISFPALAYFATADLNTDRGVTQTISYEAGVWSTAQTGYYHKLQGGYLDKGLEPEAIAHISSAIAATNSDTDEAWEQYYANMHIADSLAFHGALMRKFVRTANGYSPAPMPCALINAGAVELVTGGQTPSKDMFLVKEAIMYINPLLGYYGLGVELAYDTNKKIWYNASSQFLIGKSIHYTYPSK